MAGCECVHVSVLLYEFTYVRVLFFLSIVPGVTSRHKSNNVSVLVCVVLCICCVCVECLCLCCVLVFVLCACVCAHSGEHCTCFDILAPAQCLTLALSASSNHSFCTPCHALEGMTGIIFPDCFKSDSDNIDDVYEPQCHFRRLIPQNMPS